MIGGLVTPPIILGGAGGANLSTDQQEYLISASLIVSAILSAVQISRFHIYKTPYYVGTGLLSVVGTSFTILPVTTAVFNQMYANGTCPVGSDGTRLACPHAYGAIIGTAALCSLLEIGLSFVPPRALRRVFPPIVTGTVVFLIGASLVKEGFLGWGGDSGLCDARPTSGFFSLCPNIAAPNAAAWGSAQFLGLGFVVFVTIIFVELFGSPFMKSCQVVIGLAVGMIVAGATGYVSGAAIKAAPAATFLWVHTFPLSVYAPAILPMLAVYICVMMEAIGDITATAEVSRLDVKGLDFDSRIQGGILSDGLGGLFAALATTTPMSVFAQNNGVLAITRCVNRQAGYACCAFLLIAGIFSKVAAGIFLSIPSAVLGGMTTFLFASVCVSGLRVISLGAGNYTRRTRFILTASLSLGLGLILVPDWFNYVFTYDGPNTALKGFYDAITIFVGTGYSLAGAIGIFLNLVLPADQPEDVAVADTTERDSAGVHA